MARIPSQLSALLRDLAVYLPMLLGRNLVGIYLYGSLTQRAFNPKRSDVDCVVVTRPDLSDGHFKRLSTWLAGAAKSNPWIARLEMRILIKDQVLTMNAKACLFQFGLLKRSGSDGNPIIWMNVLKSGVVLFGPRPTFVPEITLEILFRALEREVGYLREELIEKPNSQRRDLPSYRAYAVLTLCRILYSFRKGMVVSKPRAAKWAIKKLPDEWSKLIAQALESDAGGRSADVSLSSIKLFVDYASSQLRAGWAILDLNGGSHDRYPCAAALPQDREQDSHRDDGFRVLWADDAKRRRVVEREPQGRWGMPEDAARLIAWLVDHRCVAPPPIGPPLIEWLHTSRLGRGTPERVVPTPE